MSIIILAAELRMISGIPLVFVLSIFALGMAWISDIF
jgi:hypothetical protein